MRNDTYNSDILTNESVTQQLFDDPCDYIDDMFDDLEEEFRSQKEQEKELRLAEEAEDTIIDLNDYYKKSNNVDEIPGMLATLRRLYDNLPGTEWTEDFVEGPIVDKNCIHYKLKALALIMSKRYNRVKGHQPPDYPEYGANGWNYESSSHQNIEEQGKSEESSLLYSLMGDRIYNLWLQKVKHAILSKERHTKLVVIETLGALAANRIPMDDSILSAAKLQQMIEQAIGRKLGDSNNERSRQRAIGKAIWRQNSPLVTWNQKENKYNLTSTLIAKMKYYL